MKLIVATTRSNDPEIHRPGCADIQRGRKSGKYDRAIEIEVDELADAARWFWEDFLPDGCAYEEGGPGTGMTDEQAQAYTKYLPCTKEGDIMTTTVKRTRPQPKTGDPVADRAARDTDPKHLKNLAYPSRHTQLAKHLVNEHSASPADLDDQAALARQHAELHAPAEQAYPTEDGHATLVTSNGTEPTAPKATSVKRNAKQDLARRAVLALDAMVKNLTDSDAALAGLTRDEAAKTVSQWIHHFPTGGEWPAEVLPKPDRSNWK